MSYYGPDQHADEVAAVVSSRQQAASGHHTKFKMQTEQTLSGRGPLGWEMSRNQAAGGLLPPPRFSNHIQSLKADKLKDASTGFQGLMPRSTDKPAEGMNSILEMNDSIISAIHQSQIRIIKDSTKIAEALSPFRPKALRHLNHKKSSRRPAQPSEGLSIMTNEQIKHSEAAWRDAGEERAHNVGSLYPTQLRATQVDPRVFPELEASPPQPLTRQPSPRTLLDVLKAEPNQEASMVLPSTRLDSRLLSPASAVHSFDQASLQKRGAASSPPLQSS